MKARARKAPTSQKTHPVENQITDAAYRKVVADLNDCEERYQQLDDSIKESSDGERSGHVALLRDEIHARQGLEGELLSAVDDERRRIGQDLHDDLCQRLGAAALLAGSLEKELNFTNQRQREKAAKIPELISEAIKSCRDIAKGLAPVTLQAQGLPAALQELAARVPAPVTFRWPRTKRIDFEPGVALHLYRIAEEAVGNAVKHSGATRIAIELAIINKRPVLAITNDGRGFDARSKTGGMGIRNMRYRAKVIGAILRIEPGNDGGTCIRCTLPARKEPA